MTYQHPAQAERSADNHRGLRLLALTAVVVGLMLLAAAAFVLSYAGIHEVALSAGVSARWARLYPLIFDATLVIAGAAVLSLRGAGLPSRCYAWLTMLALFAAAGGADMVHAMGIALARKPTAAAAAIIPWALVLIGFGLLLCMLRNARLRRLAAATKPETVVPERSSNVEVRAGVHEVRPDEPDSARRAVSPIVSASAVTAVTPAASLVTRPALAPAAEETPPPDAATPAGRATDAPVDPELDLALEAEPGPDDPASDEGSLWFLRPDSEELAEDGLQPDLASADDRPVSAFSSAPTTPLDAGAPGSAVDLGPGDGNGTLLERTGDAGPGDPPVNQLPPHPRVAPESTFEPLPNPTPASDPGQPGAGPTRQPEAGTEPEAEPTRQPDTDSEPEAEPDGEPQPGLPPDSQPAPPPDPGPAPDRRPPLVPAQPRPTPESAASLQPSQPKPASETGQALPAGPETGPDAPADPAPTSDADSTSDPDSEPESGATPPSAAPFDRMRSSPSPPEA